LACYTNAAGFPVQFIYHPFGEIDVSSFLTLVGSFRTGEIQQVGNIFTIIKYLLILFES